MSQFLGDRMTPGELLSWPLQQIGRFAQVGAVVLICLDLRVDAPEHSQVLVICLQTDVSTIAEPFREDMKRNGRQFAGCDVRSSGLLHSHHPEDLFAPLPFTATRHGVHVGASQQRINNTYGAPVYLQPWISFIPTSGSTSSP